MKSDSSCSFTPSDLDHLCINTIRFLSIDAVQKASSGHPGMPMGATPLAEAHLAARYNRPAFDIINHFTYGIVSDGDLMEGRDKLAEFGLI